MADGSPRKAAESLRGRFAPKLILAIARFRRAMTLGVRGAILDGQGRVFLVKHSYMPGWYLPGGGIEPGETAEAALRREVMEEGGIAIEGAAELFGLYLNRIASPRDHVALYVSRTWRQPAPPSVPNMEILDCGFFAVADPPPGTTDATRRRLVELQGLVPRSAEW